ncbi:hypothetical protein BJ170DRAFT_688211 [Xylariales sp. AK1849]|nr:hypothetical protein BJ170DRAFT_688211 [Xylariales sp. AK1849]
MQNSNETTSTHGAGAGTTAKLRDSCQACAVSKVKCPKEKPVCSRCSDRGMTCQYLFIRRPGRRRESNPSHSSNNISRSSSDHSSFVSHSSLKSNSNPKSNLSSKSNSNIDTDNDLGGSTDRASDRDGGVIEVVQRPLGTCFLPGVTSSPFSLALGNSYIDPPLLNMISPPRSDNMSVPVSTEFSSQIDENNMFAGLADFGSDINDMDFVMSVMDSSFELPPLHDSSLTRAQIDIASLLLQVECTHPEFTISEPASVDDSPSDLSRASSFASNGRSVMGLPAETPKCDCWTQASCLLETLSSASTSARLGLATPDFSSTSTTINDLAAKTVLVENQQNIETVNSMLSCSSCADDSFFLILLSMIVLKTLERYAAAARTQPRGTKLSDGRADRAARLAKIFVLSSEDQTGVASHTCNAPRDDRSRGRIAARLVLGELYRVQSLVNKISPKIERLRASTRRDLGYGLGLLGTSTLDQIESDVRKGLTSLSAEIINGLKQS